MIERMAAGLIHQMAEEEMICKKEEEYYVYAMVSLVEKAITVGSILCIGFLADRLMATLLFLFVFFSLRKRTGGFHFNTFLQCYAGTVGTYLLIIWSGNILPDFPRLVYGMLAASICMIEMIGTVNHPNMHMNMEELSESKKAARLLAGLEGAVIGFFALIGADRMYVCYMAMAVILCAALLCLAKILKQEVKVNEESQQKGIAGSGAVNKT